MLESELLFFFFFRDWSCIRLLLLLKGEEVGKLWGGGGNWILAREMQGCWDGMGRRVFVREVHDCACGGVV